VPILIPSPIAVLNRHVTLAAPLPVTPRILPGTHRRRPEGPGDLSGLHAGQLPFEHHGVRLQYERLDLRRPRTEREHRRS
jgi:hypothetical protein